MVKFGFNPMLECSSKNPKGDKRFSAFYAKLQKYANRTIEEVYQAAKVFEDGSTNLSTEAAKGRKAVNMEEVRKLYEELWDLYFEENPELLKVIRQYRGFSDVFGKEGNACQAASIYRIWIKDSLRHMQANQDKYYHLMANVGKREPCDVYCGRGKGSVYGNPYSHLPGIPNTIKVETVEEAVAQHRWDFIQAIKVPSFKAQIKQLKGKRLGCFCKGTGHFCHTIVMLAVANEE